MHFSDKAILCEPKSLKPFGYIGWTKHTDNISSSASASGSGYNKQAAALQEAIKNAGFVTDKIRIEGKNDPSSTLIELAKMVKYEGELHCLHAHT